MTDNIVCLQEGPLKLCVDAQLGGHIIEFSLNGRNTLVTSGPEIGSTFWPSPQHVWDWPPPYTLDKAPYRIERKQEHEAILISDRCPVTGLQLKKHYRMAAGKARIDYYMINPGAVPLQFAPWEISRAYGGITFYESSEVPLERSNGNVSILNGIVWHHYQPEQLDRHQKIFANGSSGWLANAYNGLLLVKQFEPTPPADIAPGEAEIEIYEHGDSDNAYIEVEQQGRYEIIPPRGYSHWQVQWYLQALPEETRYEVGNMVLPRRVKDLLQRWSGHDGENT